jgi:hypothetical protein
MTDDRQFQIRERAGLEDSKLNLEFIEFLRKWSTPLLIAIAVIAGGYALYTRYHKAQQDQLSVAFEELRMASRGERPNPTSLIAVAEQYPTVKSVALLARLQAADAYLRAVRQKAALGAAIKAEDGTIADATGVLTDDLREQYLNAAKQQYQLVLDAAKSSDEKRMMAVAASFGLAAVAESAGNFSDASAAYEETVKLAEAAGDSVHADVAKKRIADLDAIKKVAPVLSQADLPKPPAPPSLPSIIPTTPPAAPAGSPATPNTPAPTPEGAAPSTPPATPPANTPPAPADPATPK